MSHAHFQITRDDRTVTFIVNGLVAIEEIIATIRSEYPTLGARHVLWDFRRGDSSLLEPRRFAEVAAAAVAAVDHSTSRKTAYVVADGATFVKACKYLNEALAVGMPAEYSVFTTPEAAHDWLRRT